jgi:hypothetical protein
MYKSTVIHPDNRKLFIVKKKLDTKLRKDREDSLMGIT